MEIFYAFVERVEEACLGHGIQTPTAKIVVVEGAIPLLNQAVIGGRSY